jgi:hypothetical protein
MNKNEGNNIVVDPKIVFKKTSARGFNHPKCEPAVVLYERINLSVPVGGPTTTKSPSPNRQMREKQHDELNNLW